MRWMWMVLGVWATVGLAQTAPVPNPGFEEGGAQPAGWTLSQGQGAWVTENGSRVLSITGDGRNDNYWRSADIAFEPATTYRLRYRARRLQGEGGTPTTGPAWANRDLGTIPEAWTWYTQLFTTPRAVPRDQSWLRFGQWHLNGTIAFDDVSLVRAAPVYHAAGDLVLGEGEAVHGSEYVFQAPLGSGNPSRPLESHQAGFNSNRWVFGQGSELIYRHQIGERRQTAATAEVSIGYYVGGELVVEASRDCQTWLPVGTQSAMSTVKHAIPAELLPAPVVYVRLRAQARQRVGTESDPGSFQIHGYAYRASIDGEPAFATGSTRYVAVPSADERVEVAFESLGEGLPGADNTLVATVRNKTAAPLAIRPQA
ncbi:MAG: hypothetical protein HUU35_10420, partial [Armatimonadetes bacterium]|nr:hypothetical protein [Armatimonadota bacterium]